MVRECPKREAAQVSNLCRPVPLNWELPDNPVYYFPRYLYDKGADADYIFLVGLISGTSLVWVVSASSIIQDTKTQQPIIGMFELNYDVSHRYENLLPTTTHEMAHALVFAEIYISTSSSLTECYTEE